MILLSRIFSIRDIGDFLHILEAILAGEAKGRPEAAL
jgi:hypothetical protein